MRKPRKFRPTADCLESRDVPAQVGLRAHLAQIAHNNLAGRLNNPFARTFSLGAVNVSGLTVGRTAPNPGGASLNNAAVNRLLASSGALNTNAALSSLLGNGSVNSAALSRLLASGVLTNNTALNQLMLNSALSGPGTNSTLRPLGSNVNNGFFTTFNNPNFGLLGTGVSNGLAFNNGLGVPGNLGSTLFNNGVSTGLTFNNGLGIPFSNSNLLGAGNGTNSTFFNNGFGFGTMF